MQRVHFLCSRAFFCSSVCSVPSGYQRTLFHSRKAFYSDEIKPRSSWPKEKELAKLLYPGAAQIYIDAWKAEDDIRSKIDILKKEGYKITETPDLVVVHKEKRGRQVTLSWNPNNYKREEVKGWERPVLDQLREDDVYLTISVRILNKTVFFHGIVGDTDQLMLYNITPGRMTATGGNIRMSLIQEKTQHRLYDYMEALGVGDGTARFIAQYNTSRRNSQIAATLSLVYNCIADRK